MSRNFGLFFALPRSARSVSTLPIHTSASAAAIAATAPRKPASSSSAPPRKKPAPLSAFFEPVSTATQRYSAPSASAGTSSFTALLALILLRSLAMPESACAAITHGTVSAAAGTSSIASAHDLQPEPDVHGAIQAQMRAPSQPPTRLVTMPKNS